MEAFRSLQLDLEKEFVGLIQGDLVAIMKDSNSTATLFLEKVTDQKQNRCKFILHIKFWNLQTLLSDVTCNSEPSQSSKLSVPLSFLQGQNLIDVDKLLDTFEPALILNQDSSLLAINLGFGVFCKLDGILHLRHSILCISDIANSANIISLRKIKAHHSLLPDFRPNRKTKNLQGKVAPCHPRNIHLHR